MEYKAKNCLVCGSEELKLVSHKNDGENIFYTYRCLACGEVFSTETAYLDKQKRIQKQIESQAVKESTKSNMVLSATELYKKRREFVVEIKADFEDTLSNGTGIILGNGYILSNAHVIFKKANNLVETSEYIVCKFENGVEEDVDLVYANVEKDLAILYSEEIKNEGAIFNCTGVETGEKVYAIGNSKGQGICILDGIVSDKERFIGDDRYIMYSAPTVSGNSGGPLFNEKGEIIGVVTLGIKDAVAMNFAIPIKVIESFVNEANDKEDLNVEILYSE